jgi:hypothetical protein
MSQAKKRAPRGARQAEILRLTEALTRIRDLVRDASVTPGREWETLGAIAFIADRALAPVQPS